MHIRELFTQCAKKVMNILPAFLVGSYEVVEQEAVSVNLGIANNSVSNIFYPGLYIEKSKDDGHCFYHSIAATLNRELGKQTYTYQQIRTLVADFWLQQIECNNYLLKMLKSAVILYLEKKYNICTQEPNIQQIHEYIDSIKNTTMWANESVVIALAILLDRPIITLGDILPNTKKPVIYSAHGMRTTGTPIFVYYNGNNHYNALFVQPSFNPEEIGKEIYPNWQKEREGRKENKSDATMVYSSDDSGDEMQCHNLHRKITNSPIIHDRRLTGKRLRKPTSCEKTTDNKKHKIEDNTVIFKQYGT